MIRKKILLHKYSPSVFCWIRVAHLFSFLCCVVFLCFVCRHPVYSMLPISPLSILDCLIIFNVCFTCYGKQNFVQKINIFFKYDFFYLLSNYFHKMGFKIHSYFPRIYGMHTDIINYVFHHMT